MRAPVSQRQKSCPFRESATLEFRYIFPFDFAFRSEAKFRRFFWLAKFMNVFVLNQMIDRFHGSMDENEKDQLLAKFMVTMCHTMAIGMRNTCRAAKLRYMHIRFALIASLVFCGPKCIPCFYVRFFFVLFRRETGQLDV